MAITTTETCNVMIGSLCIAFAVLCYNINELIVKWSKIDVIQLLFGRFCVQFIIACIWWNVKKPKGTYVNNWYGDKPFITNIFIRGIFHNIIVLGLWYSVTRLPVGDFCVILVQNSLITALFAKIFLAEKLPNLFILIATFGIIGSLLISQPTFLSYLFNINNIEPLDIYGLLVLCISILCMGINNVLVRTAKEAHFLQLELVSSAQMIFVITPVVLLLNNYINVESIGTFHTIQFDLFSLLLMFLTGFIGFIGLSLHVIGYQLGDATKVSWLEYVSIVYQSLFQTFFWNDPFNLFESIGVILVVLACFIDLGEQYYNYVKIKQTEQEVNECEPDIAEQSENKLLLQSVPSGSENTEY
eukprot:549375_1